MRRFANRDPQAITSTQRQEIDTQFREALLDQQIVTRAGQTLAQGRPQTATGVAIGAVIVGLAPRLFILLLLIGVVSAAAERWINERGAVVVGPLGHFVSLALAFGISIALFGLSPAEMISQDVQAWVFTTLLLLTPIVLAAWIGWTWMRRRTFQYSLRSLILATVVVCVVCGLASILNPQKDLLSGLPFDLAVPARTEQGLDVSGLGKAVRAQGGQWLWVWSQWGIYGGHYWAITIWAGIVIMLHHWKSRRRDGHSPPAHSRLHPFRRRLSGLLHSISQPALLMAASFLMMYLGCAPAIVDRTEREFQQQLAFARHPEGHWDNVQRALTAVRTDTQTMVDLHQAVDAELLKPIK
jgi:hypothetical protein